MKRALNVKHLLKQGLLWGLALCLIASSFPGLNATAKAASYSGITADTTLSDGDTISGSISGCTVTIPSGATVTVTGQITISGTVNIVGGGKLLRGSFTNASMITVSAGATLNIGTSALSGVTIDGNSANVSVNGGGIYDTGGNVNLYSGAVVTNHTIYKADPFGGGIYIQTGTLKMYDGALVTNNSATASSSTTSYGGGGIAVYEGAVFNMYGGTISGNNAPSTAGGTGGGGVYSRGSFTMSGGTISGNSSGRNGGAVHLDGGANTTVSPTMTMTGGLITGNYSTTWAGGIEILAKAGLTISGGKINSNTCSSGGGGIELDANGYSGYLRIGGEAQITGNTRDSLQDDVYIDKTITVTGNFTGSAGITHETSSINAVGGVFGVNSGSYTGMENFFCDEKVLVGELSGTNVRWRSSTTALTKVALSTNTPETGTAIDTTLAPVGGSATYQWYRSATSSNSGGTLIVGATNSSYTPVTADVGNYLYVVANGTGGSTGRVVSAATTSAAQYGSTVSTPSFSVAAGTYTSAQSVSISCATDGATIYYTTDGSTPTTSSTKYSSPITVSTTATIKAIAVKTDCADSGAASAAYTIITITATPYTGTYDGTAHDAVTVSGTLTGDTITYSTDGTSYTGTCPQYTNADSYPVYVKVTSASYSTWESGLKTAEISRAAGSIAITGDPSKAYNGSKVSNPAVSKNGTGSVTYTYYNDNAGSMGTQLSNAPSAVGTYWVKAEMAQDTNYTSAQATRQFTISSPAGLLTGSVTKSGFTGVNLTTLGDVDWAVWGYASSGRSTSLSPDVRRSGVTAISSLTDIDPDPHDVLRGLGQYSICHAFNWSNGTSPASAANVRGGIQHNVAATYKTGDGFSFTVPADTTKKRLIVYTAVHLAVGELTATLSDGSAAQLTVLQDSKTSSNDPSRFVIDYNAASDGQTLTVQFISTWNNTDGNGNVQVYAVALSNYHTAEIRTYTDGTLTAASGSVELKQSGSTVATAASSGETGVYSALVLNGTYDIFIGGTDTGCDIIINGADNSVNLNYYTVNYNVTDAGKALGSTISATAGGTAIANNTAVLSGKRVIITATGKGTDSYTYAWAGDGTSGEKTAALTISSLSGKVNATCTVTGKATITGITVTPLSGTYDGAAHDACTVTGVLAGDTVTYSTDGTAFTETCPQYTDAGSHSVYVKVTRTDYTDWTSGLKTAVISRAAGSITITGDPSKNYDGSVVSNPAVSKNSTGTVTYTYYTDTAGAMGTALSGAPSDVGIYWVKAVMAEDTNYTGGEASKQFSISAVSPTGITVTPYAGTYDGSAHDAISILGTLPGDTITYSTDGASYTGTCPQYTDAGSYPVYVKVVRSGCTDWESGLVTAVISRVAGSVTITGDPSKNYDGSAVADPTVNKNGSGAVTYTYYSDNAGAIGAALPGAPSDVGTYWVKAAMAEDANYTGAEATKQFTIQNENISGITATPYAGTFDGAAHDAITLAGILAGDTVLYSTDGVNYTGTCPQYTDAGSYAVYVKVSRAGCSEWNSGAKTAVISQAAGNITITGEPSKTYDGNAIADPATSKNGSGAVTFTYYSDNAGAMGTALSGAPSAVGTYWVKAVMAQDTNYTGAEATRQFSIKSIVWFTVSYDANTASGGSVPAGSTLHAKDSTVEVLGNNGQLTKKGYTLIGWNTSADGNGAFYSAGSTFDIYCDITLYAVWQINSYQVRFEDWDGSLIKEETVKYGNAAAAPGNPKRNGYIFSGWNNAYSFISDNMTIEAQYKINTFTVSFSSNGGSNVPDQTVTYLGSATLPEEPTKSGYTFDGWFADSTLSTPADFDKIKGDSTFYAKWLENADYLRKLARNLTIETNFEFAEGDIWECVTSDFIILSSGAPGTQIVWTSSDENFVRIQGSGENVTGIVTRPKDRDASVVITATITKDGKTVSKTFLLIIKREGASKNETRMLTARTASVQTGKNTEGETIYRTVLNDGTGIDTVIVTTEKVQKLIEQSKETGVVVVTLDNYADDPANEFAFEISADTVSALAENGFGLTLRSPAGSVTLSVDAIRQATENGMELYFHIIPVADESAEVADAFQKDGTILSLMNFATKETFGVPRVIETNMEGYATTILLPLDGISADKLSDPDFLASLCIYVQHDDGTTELIHGTIMNDDSGLPSAIAFEISRFSRFQVVSVKEGNPWLTIGFCAGGVAIFIILLILLLRKKKKQSDPA